MSLWLKEEKLFESVKNRFEVIDRLLTLSGLGRLAPGNKGNELIIGHFMLGRDLPPHADVECLESMSTIALKLPLFLRKVFIQSCFWFDFRKVECTY